MEHWKTRLRDLRKEVYALNLVVRDSRTPWYAKGIGALTVGLAISPIDPIPDFIPVLGYLDDLVFIPVGVYVVHQIVPDEVLEDARKQAVTDLEQGTVGWLVAVLIIFGWMLVIGLIALFIQRLV